MSVLGYRNLHPFHLHQPYFPCHRPSNGYMLTGDGFLKQIFQWLDHNFGVRSWLTTEKPMNIYNKVVHFGQRTRVECLIYPPTFVVKKLQLLISIENFAVDVRLISEQVVDWIDILEDPDPLKSGHVQCRWPKPFDPATTVINTDGSWSYIENRGGIGCMVRTCQGQPLGAYSTICHKMPVHVIETWAVHEGLRLTATSDLGVVLIGTDATIAVSMINTVAAAYSTLVNKCSINYHNYLKESSRVAIRANSRKEDNDLEAYVKTVIKNHSKWTKNGQLQGTSLEFLVKTLIEVMYFLERLDGWGCRHIMREANKAADHLTKQAKDKEIILVKPESYPAKLLKIVEEDAAETWYDRVKQTPVGGHKCTKASGWMLPQ